MDEQWDDDELTPGGHELSPEAFSLPDAPDALRSVLLAQTSRKIRRRRWRGRATGMGLVAAAYAMGVATMAWLADPDLERTMPPVDRVHVAETESVPIEPQYSWEEAPAALFSDAEAFTLRVAQAGPEERMRLLKEGGDFYLEVRGDVKTAMNFYVRLLDLAPGPREASRGQRTTWLLATLIASRLEEMDDEHLDA